jgi:hypothetical protein
MGQDSRIFAGHSARKVRILGNADATSGRFSAYRRRKRIHTSAFGLGTGFLALAVALAFALTPTIINSSAKPASSEIHHETPLVARRLI